MPDARTADARLRRILHVLPAAAREGGAGLEDLAATLDVEPATLLRDLEEVTARSLYLPPGPADELQIQLTAERIEVWTKGEFARPVKLLPRAALALGLGLRALAAREAADADGREEAAALRRRLERHLATAPTDELQPRFEPAGDAERCDPQPTPSDVPGAAFRAARQHRPLRFTYLKPGAPAPEERTVHPWRVARAEGRWYVLGPDPEAAPDADPDAAEDAADADGEDTPGEDPAAPAPDALRLFRLDRMLDAEVGEGSFRVPDDFEAADWIDRGRLFRADDATEVVVRYSPRIARWIAEKPWAGQVTGSEEQDDGSLVVRHRVADVRWIVGHVLPYGPDAEVLEPEGVRRRVRGTVEELVG